MAAPPAIHKDFTKLPTASSYLNAARRRGTIKVLEKLDLFLLAVRGSIARLVKATRVEWLNAWLGLTRLRFEGE